MKLSKSDIGAEIISILTRGMYGDPRDALREYVQNGVDAGAKNIFIKVRQNSIVIEDDGEGMDKEIMRKAVRLGISDKNPKENVGFMGIGIYSSFHLCNQLVIYSKTKNENPNRLIFNFKNMRDLLEEQKEARFKNKINDDQLIALQSILEDNINLEPIKEDDFPRIGTRVEMISIESNFFKSLSKFEEVEEYLEQVVPLHFNPKFRWGKLIENKINEICNKHNATFRLINLQLQINEQSENLYRPYLDKNFEDEPLEPFFYELKIDKEFLGVAWGCLNSSRNTIRDKKLRGFLIKKQGFAIGNRDMLVKYFGRPAYFNRYIGEIIVVHQYLLPNAPRTDFEVSPLRIIFYDCLRSMATNFNQKANEYQEYGAADDELNNAINKLKEIKTNLTFLVDNYDALLDILIYLKNTEESLTKREQRGWIRPERKKDAKTVLLTIKELIKEIRNFIDVKKRKKAVKEIKYGSKLAEDISKVPKPSQETVQEFEFTNLIDLIDSFGIEINDDLRKILQLIDEQFIQPTASNKKDYFLILKKLRQDIEELIGEE